MEAVNGYNTRCRNKYLRFEIGIAPQDEPKMTTAILQTITREFDERMRLTNHQWIACTHRDTDNMHIHLIANRIAIDGAVYQTDFVSNRSAKAAEEISRALNLTIAKEVKPQQVYQKRGVTQSRIDTLNELRRIAYPILQSSKNPAEVSRNLRKYGARLEAVKNSKGIVYGLRVHYKNETFKGSEIGREFGMRSMLHHFGMSAQNDIGTPFIPQYKRQQEPPNSPIIELCSTVGTMLTPNISTTNYDDTETMSDAEKSRRKRLKAQQKLKPKW